MTETQILVVEDESIVAEDIRRTLQHMGYSVPSIVASGEKAIKEVEKNNPDLVLMDIMLPGKMDGIEAAEQIHSRFNIPVVYLTAYSDEKFIERAKITEPFGYIIKPFKKRELQINIEIALYKHKMEKKLKESEQWLATTLKSIGEAVMTTDKNGVIKTMNPFAEALTGWKQEDASGKSLETIFNVISEDTGKQAENPVTKLIREGSFYGLAENTILITKEGAKIPVEIIGSLIKDDIANIIGIVLVFYDIIERKRVEEIQRENEYLTYASKIKSDFLANMSHELRSPLNAVIGFSELLKMNTAGELNEKQQHYISDILTSGKHLLDLINDILDLSKVEAGKIELVIEKVHVPQAINEGLTLVKEKAMKHNISLKVELDPELEFVEVDKRRLKQILFNLLSNAVKFSKPEGGTVTVKTRKEGDMAQISVSDTGVGIRKENMGKLFKKFEQISAGITKKYGGSGLGLLISKKLVELHGGTIMAESEFGKGSTFTFLLPLKVKKEENE